MGAFLGAVAPTDPSIELRLSVPGQPALSIFPNRGPERKRQAAKVWNWRGEALDEGDEVAAWLSAWLGAPHRLYRYGGLSSPTGPDPDASLERRTGPEWVSRPVQTRFPDEYPILVACEASLAALQAELERTHERASAAEGSGVRGAGEAQASAGAEQLVELSMRRFRPNVVVRGSDAWEEDAWGRIRVGESRILDLVKPCSRCKLTTIDPDTQAIGVEPLRTLQAVRSGKALGWNAERDFDKAVFFAWNAVLASGDGEVGVGNGVSVLSRRKGQPQMKDFVKASLSAWLVPVVVALAAILCFLHWAKL
ncbi:hypothetical protein H632_c1021p1 [Helicosporidium sp. ATCC 50920]|nr:hypothetical protein H632_c1021p1 [Helicosporidium sp. ATCC 50920]|eukprot:KDD74870.1 hypothetical protein H632_c1021p1 [Helicosporidium sp. ATCC 50920]